MAPIIGADMLSVFAIACGAALGAWARWLLGLLLNAWYPSLPPGTLVANLIGGYLAGLALPLLLAHPEWPAAWRLFVITGFLGGLTTFSAFSAESLLMLQRGQWALAAGHTLAHVLGALACAAIGFKLLDSLLG